jgi:hypothetical protein
MSSDITVNPINSINRPTQLNKPSYLITYEDGSVKNKVKRFVTTEKPDTGAAFVQMKGFLTDLSEEEIISSYQEVLTTVHKESMIELMIPWQRIFSVRSLVFKAK